MHVQSKLARCWFEGLTAGHDPHARTAPHPHARDLHNFPTIKGVGARDETLAPQPGSRVTGSRKGYKEGTSTITN